MVSGAAAARLMVREIEAVVTRRLRAGASFSLFR
jgi:hypothetical protein